MLISREKENKFLFPNSKVSFFLTSHYFSSTCTTFYSFPSLSLSLTLSYLLCSQAHTGKRTCSQSWLCDRTEHLIVTTLMDPLTDSSHFPTLFKHHFNLASFILPINSLALLNTSSQTHNKHISRSILAFSSRYISLTLFNLNLAFRVSSLKLFFCTHWDC